jgi:hypothetical protein
MISKSKNNLASFADDLAQGGKDLPTMTDDAPCMLFCPPWVEPIQRLFVEKKIDAVTIDEDPGRLRGKFFQQRA